MNVFSPHPIRVLTQHKNCMIIGDIQRKCCIKFHFATDKKLPGDFDVCWADDDVNLVKLQALSPVLLDLTNQNAAQKAEYGGELFPASLNTIFNGKTHLEFFQEDKDGNSRGIIAINLS